ncbi:hypothetical protein SDC9_124675 [bioreactor metagenome]|uniref:Uncharacterized protein n=1 Tax=bioreactor metagenome TaxID=1076179 RepID=A0A645CL56_9ZZZZ
MARIECGSWSRLPNSVSCLSGPRSLIAAGTLVSTAVRRGSKCSKGAPMANRQLGDHTSITTRTSGSSAGSKRCADGRTSGLPLRRVHDMMRRARRWDASHARHAARSVGKAKDPSAGAVTLPTVPPGRVLGVGRYGCPASGGVPAPGAGASPVCPPGTSCRARSTRPRS